MADKKISELPLLNSVSGSSLVIPIVHDGTTVKLNLSQLGHYASQWSAQTGSANTFTGNQTIVGNLAVSGDITAERYYIETISSSVIYESGSTLFGNSGDDTHTFTGSIILNGATIGAAELNSFTASQLAVNLGISSVTGSINTTTASLNQATSSLNFASGALEIASGSYNRFYQATASIHSTTSSLNQATSSLNFASGALEIATGSYNRFYDMTSSVHFTTQSLNVQTGSQELINVQNSTVSSSLNFASASINFTTGALNSFTGSIISQTNTIATFTSSVNFTTQSLNTQTGSQDLVNLGISSVTGSINTTTSSFDLVFRGISSVTGAINLTTSSLIGITNGLMAFTAALDNTYATDAQLYQLYQATASIHSATASLNTQTGSQDLVNTGISSVTGSINTTTSSFNSVFLGISSVTGAINLTTASLIGITNGLMAFTAALDSTYATDAQLYQLYQATASIHFTTQSLNTQSGSQDLVNLGISTFTGSLRSEVNLIEAYTASLKAAAIVSSSTQISNYYKFAETASANTFYGTQTINGNLQLSSTSPLVYNAGNTNAMLFGFFDGGTIYGPYYQIFGSNYSNVSQRGSAEFVFDSRNGGYSGFNIAEFNGSTWLRKFRVSPSGAEVTGSFVVDGGITGSLMATNNVVSSSTQIQNYNLFAVTSSVNTFYGNQTITGSLNIAGNINILRNTGASYVTAETTATNGEAAFVLYGKNSSGTVRTAQFKYDNADVVRLAVSSPIGLQIETNDITRLTIANDGGINATGAITASNFRISTAGGGIDFGAATNVAGMTSELLNDYEEGTWSPVITDLTNDATMDGTFSVGSYTKIGRQVTVRGYVLTTSLGSVSGNVKIKGLPFTNGGGYASLGGGSVGTADGLNITAGHSVHISTPLGQSYLGLNVADSATGTTEMTSAEWSADGQIQFSVTYFV